MITQTTEYTRLNSDSDFTMTDLELGMVLGGDPSGIQTAAPADFSNSGDYRNGAMQMAGAVGGIVMAGIGLMTAPISVPLAIAGAIAAAAIGGFAAADAQMDMRNAQPDPNT